MIFALVLLPHSFLLVFLYHFIRENKKREENTLRVEVRKPEIENMKKAGTAQ